jgi:hypothetical protein
MVVNLQGFRPGQHYLDRGAHHLRLSDLERHRRIHGRGIRSQPRARGTDHRLVLDWREYPVFSLKCVHEVNVFANPGSCNSLRSAHSPWLRFRKSMDVNPFIWSPFLSPRRSSLGLARPALGRRSWSVGSFPVSSVVRPSSFS